MKSLVLFLFVIIFLSCSDDIIKEDNTTTINQNDLENLTNSLEVIQNELQSTQDKLVFLTGQIEQVSKDNNANSVSIPSDCPQILDVPEVVSCPKIPEIPKVHLDVANIQFQTVRIYMWGDDFPERMLLADKIKVGMSDDDIFDLMEGFPKLVIREKGHNNPKNGEPILNWIYFRNQDHEEEFWKANIIKPFNPAPNHIWILFNRGKVFDAVGSPLQL